MKNKSRRFLSIGIVCVTTMIIAVLTALICHLMLKYKVGDFPVQLEWAIAGSAKSYSLMDVLYRMAWGIYPEGFSAIMVVTVIVTIGFLSSVFLLKELTEEPEWWKAACMAFAAFLAGACHFGLWNPSYILGVQSGAIWHNPTYLGMKMALPAALYFLLRLFRGKGKIVVSFLGLMIVCTVGTAIKPNFLMCFGAALFITAIILVFKNKGKKDRRPWLLLAALLPSGGIVLYQYLINFTGVNSESGIAFAPFLILTRYAQTPVAAVFQSVAFWVFCLIVIGKQLWEKEIHRFLLLTTVIAYFQCLFLIETGPRMYDGNWTWGADLCNFGMILLTVPCFLKSFKEGLMAKNGKAVAAGLIGLLLLAWHVLSGVIYITLIFKRNTVWL